MICYVLRRIEVRGDDVDIDEDFIAFGVKG